MATTLEAEQLRSALADPKAVRCEGFELLREVARLLDGGDKEALGREMLLRALEQRANFGKTGPILDALARAAGLFPYADPQSLGLRDRLAYEFHRPFDMPVDIVFHREQAEIYGRLLAGENVILSAPTSFGKSRIIDAMIATDRYDNIAVVVPTLALIDETRRRLSMFSNKYKIVTHVSQPPAKRNIFVFTAERAVAYERLPKIKFFAIDEFYKLGAMDEDETRTIALNQAFYRLWKMGGQFYLLGPNIERIPDKAESAFKCVFHLTKFSTVVIEQQYVRGGASDIDRLRALARTLDEPTLVFCGSPARVNSVADALLEAGIAEAVPELQSAVEWTGAHYHPGWIFPRALLHGIGVHHGRLPRSLAHFTVRMFNEGLLRFLICTSTLIEGVNTKAKNVVIFDNAIAKKSIDYFTFNNIKGRSGRMFQHFIGRVYLFADPPQEELPFVDFPLLTQEATAPDALLVQLDNPDLSASSRDRIRNCTDLAVLPIEIVKRNNGIDPSAQLGLARALRDNAEQKWQRLCWRAFPTYDQLKYVCELIWEHLVDSRRRMGVFSGRQLARKTWQLWHTPSSAKRVLEELKPGMYAAKTPDEAVERVLQFERNWAGFDLPRYLMATSRIQAHVFGSLSLPSGDYSSFATQVESLFRPPVLAALDEYGVPLQLAERVHRFLRTTDDLDVALAQLKALDLASLRLSDFEKRILEDARESM